MSRPARGSTAHLVGHSRTWSGGGRARGVARPSRRHRCACEGAGGRTRRRRRPRPGARCQAGPEFSGAGLTARLAWSSGAAAVGRRRRPRGGAADRSARLVGSVVARADQRRTERGSGRWVLAATQRARGRPETQSPPRAGRAARFHVGHLGVRLATDCCARSRPPREVESFLGKLPRTCCVSRPSERHDAAHTSGVRAGGALDRVARGVGPLGRAPNLPVLRRLQRVGCFAVGRFWPWPRRLGQEPIDVPGFICRAVPRTVVAVFRFAEPVRNTRFSSGGGPLGRAW